MQLISDSFAAGARIPDEFVFGIHDPQTQVRLSANRNPHLRWTNLPAGTRSLALICVDRDVPTKPDDVNKAGRFVPASLPRTDFYHWVMVDISPAVPEIAAGACSQGITPRGKTQPPGPAGTRQGRNDYTGWFAGDQDMAGVYLGYDGPCPPWNDMLEHRYFFNVYALDLARCPVEGQFTATQVLEAIKGHMLAEASVMGRYAINPAVR